MSKTIGLVCLGNIARFRQQLRRLRKHETGGALIEFALVAPLLITLLVAVMEFAMVVLVMVLLEGGVREAARYGMTGQTPDDSSRLEAIADIINDHSLGLIDVTTSDVDVLVYDDFSSVDSGDELVVDVNGNGEWDSADGDTYNDLNGNGSWDPDPGVPGAGAGGEVVLYRVTASWNALTPLLAPFIGDGGMIPLSASVVVRNEPFGMTGGAFSGGTPPGGGT